MTIPIWTLQDRIRKARDHAGLNQSALAEAIGVSTNSVNRWEKGERNPTQESLESIAQATGVPMEWFYAVDESSTAPPARLDSPTPPERVVLEWKGDGYEVATEESN